MANQGLVAELIFNDLQWRRPTPGCHLKEEMKRHLHEIVGINLGARYHHRHALDMNSIIFVL